MINSTAWLVRAPCNAPRLRLFCFPYSGGQAAMFARWQHALGSDIEVCAVQLPGRAERMREPLLTSMPEVTGALLSILADAQEMPYAFFGHSVGALLAFETARRCAPHGIAEPVHLFASGCDAPQRRAPSRHLHLLPDQELIAELRQCGGTPDELLTNPRVMALFLPLVRADLSLTQNYHYVPGPPLSAPISILAGRRDDQGLAPHCAVWGRETTAESDVFWFDGDHFFVNSQREAVLDCVRSQLRRHLLPSATPGWEHAA